MSRAKKYLEKILKPADIQIGGDRPWDVVVHNSSFYPKLFFGGIKALGDGYVLNEWDCESIDELVYRAYKANLSGAISRHPLWVLHRWMGKLVNYGKKGGRASEVKRHYNAGNDLFQAMLDPRLVYTCGYWKNATTLEQAQRDKLELVCTKLALKNDMKVLDIGGGWGSFVKYTAEHHGVAGTNVTISEEQKSLADELCKGLPVENLLMDYRDIGGSYDAVVSIEMIEAVGHKNYRTYMRKVFNCLPKGGKFLLQTIIGNHSTTHTNPWIDTYIFPGGMLPSMQQLTAAADGLFTIEDVENFGPDYDKTLMAWFHNFQTNWPKLETHYDETFYRMWKLYLLSCAGAFRAQNMQVLQILFVKV